MKKSGIYQLAFACFLLTISFTTLTAQKMDKSYTAVEMLEISTLTGDISIGKSKNQEVQVKGDWDEEKIKVEIDFDGKSLKIKEEKKYWSGNMNGKASQWVLLIPDGLDISMNSGTGSLDISDVEADLEANSGTGDIMIENMEGRFDVNSGTGSIDIFNAKGKFDLNSGTSYVKVVDSEGKFDANSGTGNVKFEKVNPTGNSTLNSGTGNVKFVVASKISADLSLNSGTGNAVLDFNGTKIEGDFEMNCGIPSGKIIAPFKFDTERHVGDQNNGHIEKRARIGKADVDVAVSTGTGRAEVRS